MTDRAHPGEEARVGDANEPERHQTTGTVMRTIPPTGGNRSTRRSRRRPRVPRRLPRRAEIFDPLQCDCNPRGQCDAARSHRRMTRGTNSRCREFLYAPAGGFHHGTNQRRRTGNSSPAISQQGRRGSSGVLTGYPLRRHGSWRAETHHGWDETIDELVERLKKRGLRFRGTSRG